MTLESEQAQARLPGSVTAPQRPLHQTSSLHPPSVCIQPQADRPVGSMPSPTKRRRLSTRRPGHPVRSTERSLDALVAHSPATTRLLLKLSKQALAGLALGWLDDPRTRPSKGTGRKGRRREGSDAGSRGSGEEDSEGEDDDPDDGPADRLKKLSLYYSEVSSISKPRLVERILLDWKRGLSPSQIADADVASYVEKPASGRSWTAFELVYASPTGSTSRAATVGEQELESRLQQVLEPSFAACHVQVSKPYPPPNSPLHVRLSLLSSSLTSSIAPKPTASPVVHLLHFPATPYVLLPPLPTSLVPTVHHALCAAFSRPPGRRASSTTDRGVVDSLKELQLKGKDWRGLRELLVEGAKGASGAEWKKFRTEEGKGNVPDGEDGEALAPKERRRSVDRASCHLVQGRFVARLTPLPFAHSRRRPRTRLRLGQGSGPDHDGRFRAQVGEGQGSRGDLWQVCVAEA